MHVCLELGHNNNIICLVANNYYSNLDTTMASCQDDDGGNNNDYSDILPSIFHTASSAVSIFHAPRDISILIV